MNIVTLDFETYFDDEYSLKKMTTEAYVRDPRFEALGVAIRYPNSGKTEWKRMQDIDQEELLIWGESAILCHHAHFDGLLLSHHYGVEPRAWLDTLSMARLVLGNHVSAGLGSLAVHYGLAAKSVPYDLFKGRRWSELDVATRTLVSNGACHDVELTWQIFNLLAKDFPASEYPVVSETIKMFTEPALVGDTELLGRIWQQEVKTKRDMLASLNITAKDLGSNDKLIALLEAEGVEVQYKQGKNELIPAFAASDRFMDDLQDSDNPRVVALAEARLAVKSNIKQTRSERMGWMSTRGPLCVYLAPYAAHTTRWGGGDKLNFQNPPPALKAAICAPPGHKLGIFDASQIECRILNYVAGQWDVIERFRNGEDPYVGVAEEFYKRPITKKDDPEERQVGKVLELQCGFGSGGPKIKSTLRIRAGIELSDDDALRARDAYRNTHQHVVAYWAEAEMNIKRMHALLSFEWGPLDVRCDIAKETRRIILPNGAPLIYDTLEWYRHPETGDSYWRIKTRNGYQKLYGAKLVENVVQAMARTIIAPVIVKCAQAGVKVATTTHDDIVCCLPNGPNIQSQFDWIRDQMKQAPGWLPDIPLDCEAVLADRYEKQ